VTLEYKSSAAASAATQTYLMVQPATGGAWSVFALPNPSTGYVTDTVDVSSVVASQAALWNSATSAGVQIRFVISQSNSITTTHQVVHLDVN
ncbi:MAG: hypothetical protein ABR498_02845, partial [Candidatus Dormibacteria bacterium]